MIQSSTDNGGLIMIKLLRLEYFCMSAIPRRLLLKCPTTKAPDSSPETLKTSTNFSVRCYVYSRAESWSQEPRLAVRSGQVLAAVRSEQAGESLEYRTYESALATRSMNLLVGFLDF